jgi:hypothetical protein
MPWSEWRSTKDFFPHSISMPLLRFQNFSPTALLRNAATGDMVRQALTNVDMKLALQVCLSVKLTAVPRSRSLRSSTNS